MKVSEHIRQAGNAELREAAGMVEARVVTPLYGHDSADKAYVVDDYPYGRHRTQKRFWLERKGKKGWRFVGQTLNPKTKRWNKPKASTYSAFAGAMYLDEKGHVQWSGLHEYSDEQDMLQFVKDFPKADLSVLKVIVPMKIKFLKGRLSGEVVMTMNGKPVPVSEMDKKEWTAELKVYEDILKRVR
ncbi:MAG: hypothetical protein GWN58_33655 [Anaerolineae bacterium]|nr:hypothetical protein [Thermoplasmata archaeon]NIV34224.1 hypothetical protein [Anaerolineae bacterium]NIY06072.1 hypothetical protein [Thermoplasmata archaeon]